MGPAELIDKDRTSTRSSSGSTPARRKRCAPSPWQPIRCSPTGAGDGKNGDHSTLPEDEEAKYPHLTLFGERDWGLIVYDEVHLLPAPVFQVTASLQARRRLGLTATLVREDGKED